jgi:type I restriction enzyme S subunit
MPQNIGENKIELDGIARITSEDVQRLKKYIVKEGDVVYSRRGDVEKRALIRKDQVGWLCGTGCLRIRFGEGYVDPLYASLYLSHPNVREWIVRHAHGATMPNLNTSILSALPFVLPPFPTQKAIAHILGTLDDKIDLNRRMNETLESIARAIFKSWFIDFDPVRAKAEGRQPEGMDAETAALFPSDFEEVEGQELPKGWRLSSFLEVIDIIGGGTPKTSEPSFWDGNIPWFSVVDSPNLSDIWVVNTEKKITEEGLNNSSTKILPIGTTIITARGTVGNLALVGNLMAMNQSCYGLKSNILGDFFTYYQIRFIIEDLKKHTHGSVFDTITRDTFSQFSFVIPPDSILSIFESTIEPLLIKIKHNLNTSMLLSNTRDTLLPKLLSGELKIDNPEAFVEDVI